MLTCLEATADGVLGVAAEQDDGGAGDDFLQVKHLRVVCGSDGQSADLTMIVDGTEQTVHATGDGPVDEVAERSAENQRQPEAREVQRVVIVVERIEVAVIGLADRHGRVEGEVGR